MSSHKDFEAIAKALAEARPHPYGQPGDFKDGRIAQWEADVQSVAHALADTNPRFDHDRFFRACGLPDNVVIVGPAV